MTGFLIDPQIVKSHLQKPYDLKEAWDKVSSQPMAGIEGERHYTPSELKTVFNERNRIYSELTRTCTPVAKGDRKHFVMSAGAPGAGKSTLLENLLNKDPDLRNMVFSDPDERALKLMTVYKDDIENFGGDLAGLTLSYTKWRWASNFISGSIMNKANEDGYNILHGTTATSPFMGTLLDNIHGEGFAVKTLVVAAPDDVRVESARRRFEEEQTRFTNDTKEKGVLFYERLPLLLEKTDDFDLYWRDDPQGEAVLAVAARNGDVDIKNKTALKAIDKDFKKVDRSLSWKALSSNYRAKFG